MAGGECRLTTATRSVTGTRFTKWEECVVTLLRGTLWTAWQWYESVNMPVFTVHPSLCRPTLQFNFHTTGKDWSTAESVAATFYHQDVYLFCLEKKNCASVSSGMVDKLISCLRLLLSLRAVNGFYNLINSTLAAQWVNSLPSTQVCQGSSCTRSFLMLRKDAVQ